MISVAIDGPAGAGKSTIAKTLAKKMGFIYVDTGAMYRAIGLAATRTNTDIDNAEQCDSLLKSISVDLAFKDGEQRVLLNGEDVSDQIRTPTASMMASKVSAVSEVRAFLLDLQRNMAKKYDVIMDGRDIGTVILPNADVKIFLTASPEVRADRRYKELVEKGQSVTYEDVLKDIIERDYNDSHRAAAPLKQAEDAVLADTSNDTLEEACQRLMDIITSKTEANHG